MANVETVSVKRGQETQRFPLPPGQLMILFEARRRRDRGLKLPTAVLPERSGTGYLLQEEAGRAATCAALSALAASLPLDLWAGRYA